MIRPAAGAVAGAVLAVLMVPLAARLTHRPAPRSAWFPTAAISIGALVGLATARSTGSTVAGDAPTALVVLGFGILGLLAITAMLVDLAENRLPDVLTYPLAAAGVLILGLLDLLGADGRLVRALAGGAVWGGWMLIGALAAPRGFGLGDVKLACGLGIWLGWASWATLAVGVLVGQLLITVSLSAGWLAARRWGPATRNGDVPLGPALVLGAAVALLVLAG